MVILHLVGSDVAAAVSVDRSHYPLVRSNRNSQVSSVGITWWAVIAGENS